MQHVRLGVVQQAPGEVVHQPQHPPAGAGEHPLDHAGHQERMEEVSMGGAPWLASVNVAGGGS